MTASTVEVFELVMPDGTRRVGGKIVNLNGVLVFFRDFKGARLNKWQAFSVDERLIPLLVARGVSLIDEVDNGVVYRIPLDRFIAAGTTAEHSRREAPQVYVPVSFWARVGAPYKTEHKRETTLVPWVQPPPDWVPLRIPGAPTPSPQLGLDL